MDFEPKVLRSIRRHKRVRVLSRLLVITPLLLVIGAYIILGAWGYSLRDDPRYGRWYDSYFERWRGDEARGADTVMILIFRLAPLCLLALAASSWMFRPIKRQFDSIVCRYRDYEPGSFRKFENALEALSVGAGVEAPDLEILALPTINSISFRDGSKPVVGVTADALSSDLSRHETEAIMAHELGHVLSGDVLKPPHPLRGMNGFLLFLIAVAGPIFITFVGPGSFTHFFFISLITLLVLSFVCIPLSIHLQSRMYFISRLDPAMEDMDILADSLAVKLTNSPHALRAAIQKVALEMGREETVLPWQTVSYTNLFVGPMKEWPLSANNYVPGVIRSFQMYEIESRRNSPLAGWTRAARGSSDPKVRALGKDIGGAFGMPGRKKHRDKILDDMKQQM